MLDWLKKRTSKGIWYLLAALIVACIAGPEIIISMELMALVELLGASTFALMYISGFRLFISNVLNELKKFESRSTFFIPSLDTLKQMPVLAIHAIPERTVYLCFFVLLIWVSYAFFNLIFGA
ncbi:MAG: hypothetical protein JKX78_15300 [Alteromonadaceae bacterium]|nr:hypothetical protein [Alteromonadaceae bacterium]